MEEKKNFNSRVLELTASPPRREAKKGEERTGKERGQDKGQEGEAKEFEKNFPNFGRVWEGRRNFVSSVNIELFPAGGAIRWLLWLSSPLLSYALLSLVPSLLSLPVL